MSFRDEVNNTTKSVMIETFITSLFSEPRRRFGDILDDLLENDDPDDDWMRETLYDMEVTQLVEAGMRILGLSPTSEWEPEEEEEEDDISDNGLEDVIADAEEDEGEDDGVVVTETEDGTEYSLPASEESEGDSEGEDEPEEETEEKPKKKRKKKKKKGKKKPPPADAAAPRKKKRRSVPAKKPREDVAEDKEWEDYKRLIVKALRAHKAYDDDTAVNNAVILNEIHGEDSWAEDESAQLRAGINELREADKIDTVGQRRGTRYFLN